MKSFNEKEPRKHRHFYVNDRLEFSLWYDESITDKDTIIKDFLASKDFKSMADYCGWNVKKVDISDDLMRVDVRLKPEKKFKKRVD